MDLYQKLNYKSQTRKPKASSQKPAAKSQKPSITLITLISPINFPIPKIILYLIRLAWRGFFMP
jgi:hypothetical protein